MSAQAKAELGALSGYAWSENAGWINFAPSGGGVSLDNTTGELKGYAWGENIGWLSFNCLDASSCATSDYRVNISSGFSMGCRPATYYTTSCPVCEKAPVCAVTDIAPPVITEMSVIDITKDAARIIWKTDEKTDSIIEYGLDESYKFLTGNPGDITTKVLSHTVDLKNLLSDSSYHFKIMSRDSSGNIFVSADQVFKTLRPNDTDKPSNPDNLQLIFLEEATVRNLTNYSASIFWQTDMKANSLVRLKRADAPDSEWQEIGDTGNYTIEHLVNLTGLKANTLYQYQVKSSSSAGSTAISKTKNFKTKPAATVSDVAVSDITLSSAVVSWKTNIASTTAMDYGFSAEYGLEASASGSDLSTSHEIKLKNLKSGAIYSFRTKGSDDNGNLIVSDNYVFTTFAMPLILSYGVESVGDNFAVLKWTSNTETDSIIAYTNTKTAESRTQGDTKFSKDHLLKVADIDAGADYIFKIGGADIFGNKVKGPEIKIKTPEDKMPPNITAVRTFTTIIQNKDKGQLVVVWKTDEPSTSQLFLYSMSDKNYPVYTSLYDANPTTNHTVVISELALGSVFRFKVESKDKTGNSSFSDDFSILTPSVRKSIIQMIIETFEKMFSWTRKLKI